MSALGMQHPSGRFYGNGMSLLHNHPAQRSERSPRLTSYPSFGYLSGLSVRVLDVFGLLPHGKPVDGATFIRRKLFQPSSYSCYWIVYFYSCYWIVYLWIVSWYVT